MNSKNIDFAHQYRQFQSQCTSPYHVSSAIETKLVDNRFKKLELTNTTPPHLPSTDKDFYFKHNDGKTIVAISLGESPFHESGFKFVGSHVDSPAFKLKSLPLERRQEITCFSPQSHGGMILRSWLDRPLVLSGLIHTISRDDSGKIKLDHQSHLPQINTQLACSKVPFGVIPDLAIHLDRTKNENGALNPETMMKVIERFHQKNMSYQKILQTVFETDCPIDGIDLFLSPLANHEIVGWDQSMIVGPRHDDIAMVYSSLEAILAISKIKTATTNIAVFYDAEETGSQTSSGARSCFLRQVLSYLFACNKRTDRDIQMFLEAALSKSFFISADMAHAFHPSHEKVHDENHRPCLNKGVVIKDNANDHYTTSGYSSSVVQAICESNSIPHQFFVARQDMGCGSTIGPATAANLGCAGVDLGAAMWGMHSSAETMGVQDLYHLKKFFEFFWSQ